VARRSQGEVAPAAETNVSGVPLVHRKLKYQSDHSSKLLAARGRGPVALFLIFFNALPGV
jgi:hypothetical protein